MKTLRVFVSIDIPKNIQKEIKKIQDALPEFKGKKTKPENLHLTLKFLGEISEEKMEKVKDKLNEIKFNGFETEINAIGVFLPSFIRIIWLHLTNCEKLQKTIDEKLSEVFKPEKRFMSHLTIARVKSVKNKTEFLDKLKGVKIPKMKFKVKEFKLKKSDLTSEGPVFETVEVYSLI